MSRFVLVHGGLAGSWLWEKLVPLLEDEGHRVEAPGPSRTRRRSTPEVSLQGYADRISEVLDAQPKPAILVGQSMGERSSARPPNRVPTR